MLESNSRVGGRIFTHYWEVKLIILDLFKPERKRNFSCSQFVFICTQISFLLGMFQSTNILQCIAIGKNGASTSKGDECASTFVVAYICVD